MMRLGGRTEGSGYCTGLHQGSKRSADGRRQQPGA